MNILRTTLPLLIVVLLASCSAFKPTAKSQIQNIQASDKSISQNQPQFLEVKSILPQRITAHHTSSGGVQSFTETKVSAKPKVVRTATNDATVNAEVLSMLQIKYSIALDVAAESITNLSLYQAIEEWYGTRYRFGGTTKKGIDCSSLMQKLYTASYNLEIPRTAITQYRATTRLTQDDLKEGDLIFFHTTRSGISHVGLYLGNRRFIHASSSRGVVISNLDESYYVKAYRGAGRFEQMTDITAK
jgi:cell wall-associated NlpC family hydrolase